MSDVMLFGVLRMPIDMAMGDRLSRLQYWQRGQEACDRIAALERQVEELKRAVEWYGESSNWKRMTAGPGNRSWSRSAAMIDKGDRAKFVLTQLDAALGAGQGGKGNG